MNKKTLLMYAGAIYLIYIYFLKPKPKTGMEAQNTIIETPDGVR